MVAENRASVRAGGPNVPAATAVPSVARPPAALSVVGLNVGRPSEVGPSAVPRERGANAVRIAPTVAQTVGPGAVTKVAPMIGPSGEATQMRRAFPTRSPAVSWTGLSPSNCVRCPRGWRCG